MKFGAVAPKDCARRDRRALRSDRAALVLKKGTLIGAAEVAALEAAGIKDSSWRGSKPGDVSEDVAAAEIAEKVAGEGVHVDRAFTGRANLFAQSRRRARRRQGRHRPTQPRRRGDHLRDAVGLQAGGRGRDDRDGQDHSVRGRQGRLRRGARRRARPAAAGRAVSHSQGWHGVHDPARACRRR